MCSVPSVVNSYFVTPKDSFGDLAPPHRISMAALVGCAGRALTGGSGRPAECPYRSANGQRLLQRCDGWDPGAAGRGVHDQRPLRAIRGTQEED